MAKQRKFNNLGERIYWAYANMSMFFYAGNTGKLEYDRSCWIIREKMFKGFKSGATKVRSMFIDQRGKIYISDRCAYCGISFEDNKFALDHILPRSKGGKDTGDNLISVCKSCNSSKKDLDLLEWWLKNEWLPDPWILRTYLKLVLEYCIENDLMDKQIYELDHDKLPFKPNYLPYSFPTLTSILIPKMMIRKCS